MFRPWPKRITRYVWSELNTPVLLGLLLYTFVLLMNRFFLVAERALAKNLGWDITLRLILLYVPNLLVLSIPMAVLLGCLIGIGRLSADHEWVALQGAGQGVRRLLWPLVLFGMAASLVSFLIYSEMVPRANYALRNLRGEMMFASNLAADLKPRVFYTNIDNVVLFVDEIPAGSQGRLEGILLVQSDPQRGSHELFLASYGYISPSPDGSGALLIDLYDGVAHVFGFGDRETYRYLPNFSTVRRRVEPAAYLQALLEPPNKVVQDYTASELWQEFDAARRDLKATDTDPRTSNRGEVFLARGRVRRAMVEVNQRLALPLTCLFFAILSLPLGITRVRSGKGAGFAMSLLVILIYWAAFTFARDQSLQGKIPAFLGPWAGNLLILPWALFGLWRLRRAREDRGGLLYRAMCVVVRGVRGVTRLLPARTSDSPASADPEPGDELAELTDLAGTPNRFVGRIDQYVGIYFLRLVVFALASAYLIYALVESKTLMDGLLRTQQPLSLMLAYFKYFAPGILSVVLPIACLIGAVVAMTLLARTGELTAIKAIGTSMRRVTLPILVLTSLLSVLLFFVEDRIAPPANRKAQALKDQILGRAPRTYGMPITGRWAFGPEGRRLYHYQLYDTEREVFQGLRVFTVDRAAPRITDHRFSERARWNGDVWELESGYYRTFPPDGSLTYAENAGTLTLQLDPPGNFASKELGLTSVGDLPEQLNLAELRQQIDTLKDSGYDITQLRVALHGKLAKAVTPLIMVLLGLPFAFKVGRRGSLYGIGVAFVLVLVYWAIFALFNALGLETILDPRVAAWAPNILFGLLGAYLMLYIRT